MSKEEINHTIIRLMDRHKTDSKWPTRHDAIVADMKLAKSIVNAFEGQVFTVHDVVPSELLWAKQTLKRSDI